MKKYLPILKSVLYFSASCLFFYTFYSRFYKWKDCFNELGRCYNPDGSGQVYLSGGAFWIFFALPFLLLSVLNLAKWIKNKDQ